MSNAKQVAGTDAGPVGGGRPRPGAGFTLVEMLIALVITGIMAAGVITLLMGQNRFYGSTDDVVYAEQNLRATSDLLGSELRSVFPGSSTSTDSDLVTAQDDELTFRLDRKRGVVCAENSGDVYVFLFSEPSAPNVQTGDRGHAVRQAYNGSTWTYDSWDPMSATMDRAPDAGDPIAVTCDNGAGPTPTSDNYSQFVVFRDWGAAVPALGSVLRIYGQVTYSFGPSGFGSGTAVFRNGQELAGPFEADAAFSYVMDGGTVESSVASTDFENVERIRVSATAVGEGTNRYDVTRDLEFDIPLKNREN